jgi:hypothetical protein
MALGVLLSPCQGDIFCPLKSGGCPMAQDILSVFVENLINACAASEQVAAAQSVSLQLAPQCESWSALPSRCDLKITISPCAPVDGSKIALADFIVTETPAQGHFVTDLVDLTVDLLSDSDVPVAQLVLSGVQHKWNSKSCQRSLNAICKIAAANLLAIRGASRMVASQFLSLIEQLADIDEAVAVPSLTGFLRVLSDKAPTRSQLIALQISGLVESPINAAPVISVTVTDAARDLLRQSGLNCWPAPTCMAQMPEPVAVQAPEPTMPQNLSPFARLRIMERDYLIAETPITDALCFRAPDQADWTELKQNSADGWTAVAAEIIERDVDVLAEFTRMHIIRRRDMPTEEVAEIFEILGVLFWLRRNETSFEMRVVDGDWAPLDIAADAPQKERALRAALALHAQSGIGLDKAARDWALRMAHATQVTPYMGIAAQ